MNDRRLHDRVTQIVADAIELPASERQAFVTDACGDDRACLNEVLALLALVDDGDDPLETPAPVHLSATLGTELDSSLSGGETLGSFRIESILGAGGMGTVYLAHEQGRVDRNVALKVLRRVDQPDAAARFAAECRTLARLAHPNVAVLYRAGVTGDDEAHPRRAYVAMEWIDGEPIVRWSNCQRLSLQDRLKLFCDVCSGVRHAHQRGVLHCDLKPSNVLVTEVDGNPVAKVIDFSISQAVEEPEAAQVIPTHALLGSPLYLSPEAAEPGGWARLDVRTDVHGLGLILYELLAGALPFGNRNAGVWASIKQLADSDPPLASDRYSALSETQRHDVAQQRSTSPSRLRRQLRGDLDAILRQATARDPDHRYATVDDLLADIERHLRNEPIEARPSGGLYVASRYIRRHRGPMLASLVVIAVLIAGIVARTHQAQRAEAQTAIAQAALEESRQTRDLLIDLIQGANPNQATGTRTLREILDDANRRIREAPDVPSSVQAELMQVLAEINTNLGDFDDAEAAALEAIRLHEAAGDVDALANSQDQLGVIYRRQGRDEEALAMHETALEFMETTDDPLRIANTLNNVGNVNYRMFKHDEAEAAHRRALALRQEAAPNSLAVALSLNNVAAILNAKREIVEGVELAEQALELFRVHLGDRHVNIAAAVNNLGLMKRTLPQWQQSLVHFQEASLIWTEAYGEAHPWSVSVVRNLAVEMSRVNRYDQALAMVDRLIALEDEIESMVDVVHNRRARASILHSTGDYEAALEWLETTLALADDTIGSTHSAIRVLNRTKMRALGGLDDVAGVEAVYRAMGHDPAAPIAESLSAENDALAYARAMLLAGQPSRAEPKLETLLDRWRANEARSRYDTGRVGYHLGRARAALGKNQEALAAFEAALADFNASVGDHHPMVGSLQCERADTLSGPERRAALAHCFAIRSELYPSDDPDLFEVSQAFEAFSG